MSNERKLSVVWLKAAVVGCLWASSEIVLGSFLHNLRVPFSSILLTSIGIILMISISFQWKEKGLIWRSGLICALMKSVSPSAVIFGPMIAIMSEALLLEISVRLIGRNIAGFLLGSLLAMSWNFIQKIGNYLIFYGFNIVDLYESMVKFAEKQLHMHFDTVYMPLIVLWIFYLSFGFLSALAGIYIGKTAYGAAPPALSADKKRMADIRSHHNAPDLNYSAAWLLFNFLALPGILLLMNFTSAIWWIPGGLVLLVIWATRYKTALRPLMKPKFWMFFIVITMLSSYLFSRFQAGGVSTSAGLMIGLQMNFRAAIMIVGFSVIGKELSNPVIRAYFMRTSFRQLPIALEIAFEALPFMISNLPPAKQIFSRPLGAIRTIINQSEFWLGKMALTLKKKNNVVIVTGEIGSGKTSFMSKLAERLASEGIKAGGIIAPARYNGDEKTGYSVIDLQTSDSMQLSSISESVGMAKVGRYFFSEEALAFGRNALSVERNQGNDLVLIDEVGAWELQGQGWAGSLNELIINCDMPLILTVRRSFLELVIENWMLQNPLVIEANDAQVDSVMAEIERFAKHN